MLAEQLPDGALLVAHYDRVDDLSDTELSVVQAIASTLDERLVTAKPLTFLPESEEGSPDPSSNPNPLDLYSDTDTTLPPTYRNALTGEWVKSPQQEAKETVASCERIRTNTTREVVNHVRCHSVIDQERYVYCPNLVEVKRTERLYQASRERFDLWVADPGQYERVYCYECR